MALQSQPRLPMPILHPGAAAAAQLQQRSLPPAPAPARVLGMPIGLAQPLVGSLNSPDSLATLRRPVGRQLCGQGQVCPYRILPLPAHMAARNAFPRAAGSGSSPRPQPQPQQQQPQQQQGVLAQRISATLPPLPMPLPPRQHQSQIRPPFTAAAAAAAASLRPPPVLRPGGDFGRLRGMDVTQPVGGSQIRLVMSTPPSGGSLIRQVAPPTSGTSLYLQPVSVAMRSLLDSANQILGPPTMHAAAPPALPRRSTPAGPAQPAGAAGSSAAQRDASSSRAEQGHQGAAAAAAAAAAVACGDGAPCCVAGATGSQPGCT